MLCSPSSRARETCELSGCGARADERADLLEWDYGDYEGLTSAEIKAERPDWNLWRDGCPGGETPADVGARADRVIAELHGIAGCVAVFSHGHMLRVLGARWIEPRAGTRSAASAWRQGALCVLAHEHDTPILARWNDLGGVLI